MDEPIEVIYMSKEERDEQLRLVQEKMHIVIDEIFTAISNNDYAEAHAAYMYLAEGISAFHTQLHITAQEYAAEQAENN